jgi:hypothetical protein
LANKQRRQELVLLPKKKSFYGVSLERKAGLASENKIKKLDYLLKFSKKNN